MWIYATAKGEKMYQILYDLFLDMTKEEKILYLNQLYYDSGGSRISHTEQAPFP